MKLQTFNVPLAPAELTRFKKWCASQDPRRSMGSQIRLWIKQALAARKPR
jgi:hypothetical protein